MRAPAFVPTIADRSRLVQLDFGRLFLRDLASRPSGPDPAPRPSGPDPASRPSGPDPAPRSAGPDAPRPAGPDAGEPGRPPLLCIHGLLVYGHAFRGLAHVLADSSRLLIPDLPGTGDSDRPPPVHCAGYSPTWLARVLLALLDHLGLERVDVLGHSWGGAVAVCLADIAPARVRRLVLADATCFAMPLPIEGRLALVPHVGPYVFKNLYRRSALAVYLARAFADPTRLAEADLDLYWDRLARTGGREAAYAMLTQLANDDRMSAMLPRLRELACETLVVWGDRDAIVPHSHAARLAAAIPGARLTWLSGCGHAVAEERPDALAALVREHLAP